jgi:uncharacterized protein (TIGR03435 family)
MRARLRREPGLNLDRPFIDRTGITGKFDVDFNFTRESGAMVTALRDQLGVKVDAARGSAETLVIDQVDKPAPD